MLKAIRPDTAGKNCVSTQTEMSRSFASSLISLRFAGILLVMAVLSAAIPANAQSEPVQPIQPTGKTIFRDSDGNLITNDEFVDIRMANFHIRDTTVTRVLPDGTVEFRLQKVPQEGMPMPDFSVTDIDGETITSADLAGKVVVLNFWFIGCPACVYETPKLNKIAEKFADEENVVFIGLTYDPAGKVRNYIKSEPFRYRLAGDAQPQLDKFGFSGYPKNIVVGADGKIKYWRSTIKAWEKFESVIDSELEKIGQEERVKNYDRQK